MNDRQELMTLNAKGTLPDIPEDALEFLKEYAGVGYSEKTEDGLTPILSILQDNSGEVKRNHERHMEGAESGMFIIRSLRKLYSGGEGIFAQPFGFHHSLVEWTGDVGEGVPVGRFPFDDPPNDMFETPDPQNPGRKVLRRRSSMNRMVDTREHYANIIDGMDRPYPVVIPMSGSNHAASRLWTDMMRRMVYNGIKLPGFCRAYKLTTVFRKKGANQTWYAFQVEPGSTIVDRELLELGAAASRSLKEAPLEGNLSDMATGEIDEAHQAATAPAVDPANVI